MSNTDTGQKDFFEMAFKKKVEHNDMTNVAITGMGAISALGNDIQSIWSGLLKGRTGIRKITGFDQLNLRNTFAGEILINSDMIRYAARMKISNRLLLFSCIGIDQALEARGLSTDHLNGKNIGIVIGTSLGMSLSEETIFYPASTIPESENLSEDLSYLSKQIKNRYNIPGDVLVVSTACASGAHAIGIGKDMILYEGYDMVICGGVDSLDRIKYLGHSALNTLTPTSMRPYDLNRNGTLFGEGSAFLVMERETDSSEALHIHAYCRGAGYSCDAYHVTTPDPEGKGAIYAMKQALMDASLTPDDIAHINLHGSGTKLNDSVEAAAVNTVFGRRAGTIPATSVKPAIGHTMGAAGALEAVVSILSLRNRQIPATQNILATDPELSINLVTTGPQTFTGEHVMSNSFGFGGSNGVLIFSAC